MNQSVVIKANNYGIAVILDPEPEFSVLKEMTAEKFREAAKFLGDATLVLSLEGRELTAVEERELLSVISSNSQLHIACLLDRESPREETFKKKLTEKLQELEARTGQFYKGNLRSGQVAEFDSSVIILGDVNPGAKVISRGNIVVLGALKGIAAAGIGGNENAFVAAWKMQPVQIRIGDYLARAADRQEMDMEEENSPQIAYVEDGNIYVEALDKNTLNFINI